MLMAKNKTRLFKTRI